MLHGVSYSNSKTAYLETPFFCALHVFIIYVSENKPHQSLLQSSRLERDIVGEMRLEATALKTQKEMRV